MSMFGLLGNNLTAYSDSEDSDDTDQTSFGLFGSIPIKENSEDKSEELTVKKYENDSDNIPLEQGILYYKYPAIFVHNSRILEVIYN